MYPLKRVIETAAVIFLLAAGASAQTLRSPDGRLAVEFKMTGDGVPQYSLTYNGKSVVRESRLGIELGGQPDLIAKFHIVKFDSTESDETWKPVWGEVSQIRNHYRQGVFTLEQKPDGNSEVRRVVVTFRVFNDGIGFRYEFPQQDGLKYFTVKDEKTEINLTGDHKAFWIPGDYDTNEYRYSTTKLSEIHALAASARDIIGTRVTAGDNVVQTPLMLKTADGLYINIHEAALVNYPAMYLAVDPKTFGMQTLLAPNAVGSKAFLQTPAKTPWRTIIVSDKAADILTSKLILNLNEPTKLADTSWIKPGKFVGVWWEMHVGTASWNYADGVSVKLGETDFSSLKPNGKHGANTANVKRYIDFAAANGIDGVLVEGWNVGWEDWYGNWKEEVFDFVTPYPDFDLAVLEKYAKEKGVKLIMHHETSASVTNYERRMDDAFRFMKQHGYDAVKTGYVGRIIPRGEYHDGQWMVNHYIHVADRAAENRIMVDAHEPVRPTGLQRTYPNWMASEAGRGNEYNAWSVGNPPEHETIMPFTRLIGGPMDYTPGIFQIKLDFYEPGKKEAVHTTLAKQLALYVTMYSPLQMAADLPQNYEKHLDAFQFIRDVAVDWDDTRVIEAEPGDYLTIARKAKGKDAWFIGAITDENARIATAPLDFLSPGEQYLATIYSDAADAHWDRNPAAYTVRKYLVTNATKLKLSLAEGGGAAISIVPATAADSQKYTIYR